MAWNYNPDDQALTNAKTNLRKLSANEIRTIWAEWMAAAEPKRGEPELDKELYEAALKWAGTIAPDILAELVWEYASERGAVNESGTHALMCPWDCGGHSVSFNQ